MTETNKNPTPRGRAFWELAQTTLLAFILAQLVVRFVAQPYHVEGASMRPNFSDGDYILTDKLSYLIRSPRRGEVITFLSPEEAKRVGKGAPEFIKRVIGIPGDILEIREDEIFINSTALNEDYLPYPSMAHGANSIKGATQITIPDDYYLVLGDNRGHSYDSRYFGLIQEADIGGRAIFRYWPLDEIQPIMAPEY